MPASREKRSENARACKLEAFSQEQLEDKLRYALDLISKELKRYKFIDYGEERRKDDSIPEVSFHFFMPRKKDSIWRIGLSSRECHCSSDLDDGQILGKKSS